VRDPLLVLRAALCGAFGIIALWSALRILKRGRFTARGGTVVIRGRAPVRFWASLLVLVSISGGFLTIAGLLMSKWWVGE